VQQCIAAHQTVLDDAFAAHPERFPNGRPVRQQPDREVWINKPRAERREATPSSADAFTQI
jgi:hypothetical protein